MFMYVLPGLCALVQLYLSLSVSLCLSLSLSLFLSLFRSLSTHTQTHTQTHTSLQLGRDADGLDHGGDLIELLADVVMVRQPLHRRHPRRQPRVLRQ
jgi:hypothetical protein